MVPPPLSLQKYLEEMQALKENARRFCHDAVNIATFKPYLIKKFYDGLVEEARQQFELTRLDTERWLRGALGPLNAQITERQSLMLKRVENLRNLKDNMSSVQDRLRQLEQQKQSLKKQSDQIDELRSRLALTSPFDRTANPITAPFTVPVGTTSTAVSQSIG
jgi:multidrug efflux pump subunit AcrA (membrane-fusion protein)